MCVCVSMLGHSTSFYLYEFTLPNRRHLPYNCDNQTASYSLGDEMVQRFNYKDAWVWDRINEVFIIGLSCGYEERNLGLKEFALL